MIAKYNTNNTVTIIMMNRHIISTPCILWIMLFVTIQDTSSKITGSVLTSGKNKIQLPSTIKAHVSNTSSPTNQIKQASSISTANMVKNNKPSTSLKTTDTSATKQTNIPKHITNQHTGRTKPTITIGQKTTSSSISITRFVRRSSPNTATEITAKNTSPLQKKSTALGATHAGFSPAHRRTTLKHSLTSTPNKHITTTRPSPQTVPRKTSNPPANTTHKTTTSVKATTITVPQKSSNPTARTIHTTKTSIKATTKTVPQKSSNPTATTIHTTKTSIKATTKTVPRNTSNPTANTIHKTTTSVKATTKTVPQKSSNPTATTIHTTKTSIKTTTQILPRKSSNPTATTIHTTKTKTSIKATTKTVPQKSSNPTATTIHTTKTSINATTQTVPRKSSNPPAITMHTTTPSVNRTTTHSTTPQAKLSTTTIEKITSDRTHATNTTTSKSRITSHITAVVTGITPKYTTMKVSEKTANASKPTVHSRTTVVQTTLFTTNRRNATTEPSGAFTTQKVDTTRVLSEASLKKKDIKYVIVGAFFAFAVVVLAVVTVVVRRRSALQKSRVVLDDKDPETMAADSSIKEAETLVLSTTTNDRDSTIKNPMFTESEQKLYAVG